MVVCAKYGSNSTGKYRRKSIADAKIKSDRRGRKNRSATPQLVNEMIVISSKQKLK
jgi:hypothetical protein